MKRKLTKLFEFSIEKLFLLSAVFCILAVSYTHLYGCVLDIAVEDNIVNKSGAWFNYGEEKLGQGRENAKKYLAENPELFAEIEAKVKAAHGIGETAESEEK